MKKIIMLVIILITAAVPCVISAEESGTGPKPVTVSVNGAEVVFPDQEPVIIHDRTFLPIRAVAESLYASVEWIEGKKCAVVSRNGVKAELFIGNSLMVVTDERTGRMRTVEMDVEPVLRSDRTLLPLRYIAEAFGTAEYPVAVEWESKTKTVLIGDGYREAIDKSGGVPISHQNGNFKGPVRITVYPPADGKVRYTLDGSEPMLGSEVYEQSFVIDRNTTFRAAVISDTGLKGKTSSFLYTFDRYDPGDGGGDIPPAKTPAPQDEYPTPEPVITPQTVLLTDTDCIIENGVLKEYYGREAYITLPDGVTEIGEGAFADNKTLKAVIMPGSVKRIGYDAFNGCTDLYYLKFSENTEFIGLRAFYGCYKLERADIPESTAEIGELAFFNCSALKTVSIPANVAKLGKSVFRECWRLKTVRVFAPVDVDGGMFRGCTEFENIIFYYKAERDVRISLEELESLRVIDLPEGILTVPEGAFYGCKSLKELKIPETVTAIGDHAFSNCSGILKITVPKSVGYIGSRAFSHCKALTGIYFEGNAPRAELDSFEDLFTTTYIYYKSGTTGWDTWPWDRLNKMSY